MKTKEIISKVNKLQNELDCLSDLRKYRGSIEYKFWKFADKNLLIMVVFVLAVVGTLLLSKVFEFSSATALVIFFTCVIGSLWCSFSSEKVFKKCAEALNESESKILARFLRDFAKSEYVASLDGDIVSKDLVSDKPMEMAMAFNSGDQKEKLNALEYLFGNGIFSFVRSVELIDEELIEHEEETADEREIEERKKALEAL
ncbi:MAG: hypothetical protein ACI8Q1_003160 [Parvicella sp.]|jgi:hypothetical protein